MNSITLTASMRTNLASLKTIATQMNKTQNILSTGKKVNSAIDNASSYYQARALTNRAADLSALLDSMGQGIQTIQAATEGLTSATTFLEQATAVANQALSEKVGKTYKEYIDEGYKEITSAMSADEIEALLVDDAKVILKDNITLSEGLEITAKNVTIYGNGKTLTVNADDTAAITVKGKENSANISDLKIVGNGTNTYGIKATESGTITIDSLDNVSSYYYRNGDFFNGKEYTQAIYDQLSDTGSVSGTATEYAMNYKADGVADNDADFGKGQWYIGAIGEWTDLYGYDYEIMSPDAKTYNKIKESFDALGSDAEALNLDWHYTSSERSADGEWVLSIHTGDATAGNKDLERRVRCFNEVNYTIIDGNSPQVGDIMYSDKTWSSADDYDKMKADGKIAVGVVFDNDNTKNTVKIVALQTSNPIAFGGKGVDFENVPSGFYSLDGLKNTGEIIVTHEESAGSAANGSLKEQYGSIMNEFDKLINDTSYQGVNLLKGADLTLTFNESRSNKFTVSGRDMSAENLGLITRDWTNKADVETSIKELTSAVDAIREFQTELGNNYSIIQTRQNFTEALTDVLETGADNLVLADMNEASAEYLMLQTRQQLATNSLSLAAQSAQSILSLF